MVISNSRMLTSLRHPNQVLDRSSPSSLDPSVNKLAGISPTSSPFSFSLHDGSDDKSLNQCNQRRWLMMQLCPAETVAFNSKALSTSSKTSSPSHQVKAIKIRKRSKKANLNSWIKRECLLAPRLILPSSLKGSRSSDTGTCCLSTSPSGRS